MKGYHHISKIVSKTEQVIEYLGANVTSIPGGDIHLWAPFYQHGLTLILAWISNYIHYKLWDEITYPFLNFNCNRWSFGMDK